MASVISEPLRGGPRQGASAPPKVADAHAKFSMRLTLRVNQQMELQQLGSPYFNHGSGRFRAEMLLIGACTAIMCDQLNWIKDIR